LTGFLQNPENQPEGEPMPLAPREEIERIKREISVQRLAEAMMPSGGEFRMPPEHHSCTTDQMLRRSSWEQQLLRISSAAELMKFSVARTALGLFPH
jgi:hypothetical protein